MLQNQVEKKTKKVVDFSGQKNRSLLKYAGLYANTYIHIIALTNITRINQDLLISTKINQGQPR